AQTKLNGYQLYCFNKIKFSSYGKLNTVAFFYPHSFSFGLFKNIPQPFLSHSSSPTAKASLQKASLELFLFRINSSKVNVCHFLDWSSF
ncbi:MAG: hypothetical protein KAG97_02370, partial [Victivallales bacterium]|nr:hypothetical protein [Victivallales bacterium]